MKLPVRLPSLLGLLVAMSSVAHAEAPAPTFTAAQLRADLAEIRRAVFEMPANLAHSANPRAVERAIAELDESLKDSPPLTRDEAWRAFATLNPLLADGHLFVGFIDWRADVREHLANGGRLFPLGVRVTPDCRISLHDASNASLRQLDGASLRKVNGIAARTMCEQMLERVHGDTRAFRADLLERRFWFFYWKLFGAPEKFNVVLESGGTLDLDGSTAVPDLLVAEQDFDRQFELTMLPDAAILKLGSFAWPNKEEVLAFTRRAFESLNERHVKTLIIDLRDNGGGNDDQWIEGVMPNLATKRWRTASTYRKRVIVADPATGEKAGDVIAGVMQTWYEPQPAAARFGGKVYVAIGPGTYSSAVVMATVFQDFGFGEIIGAGNSVRANQSGGTRRTTLTHSGLIVVTPRFVLTRPSGARRPEWLAPDRGFDATRPLSEFIGK
jgi:hypothetical protein